METLHCGVIVLKNDFDKTLIRSIYNRYVFSEGSIKWLVGEIKLIGSSNFMLISKPDWCSKIRK